MGNKELLLKLSSEQLLMRIIRYNKLVNYNAPEMVRGSELRMILESLCLAVDLTKEYPVQTEKTSHKDFIKKPLLEKWAKRQNLFFDNACAETLEQMKYNANRGLISRAEEINKVVEKEKLDHLHMRRRITDIENYKINKMFEGLF